MAERSIRIDSPGGPALEARLDAPPDAPGGLVLCHPHPLYGGDMESPVVLAVAAAARAARLATLRFNFRGVGGSAGVHDGGDGERVDAARALATLSERLPPDRPVGLGGYSFGAWVAVRVAPGPPQAAALCLIAPPLDHVDATLLEAVKGPLLLVAGTRDPYCRAAALAGLASRLTTAETLLVEGADHFFLGGLSALEPALERWARRWIAR